MVAFRTRMNLRVVRTVLALLLLFACPVVRTSPQPHQHARNPSSSPSRRSVAWLVSTRRRFPAAATATLSLASPSIIVVGRGGNQQPLETRTESDDAEQQVKSSTLTCSSTRNTNATNMNNNDEGFTLLSDTVLHDHWRRLILRRVQLPSGLVADFEIVGQRGSDEAVLVFCWNTRHKTATLLREYMPAMHGKRHGLAAGMVEWHKHHNDDDDDDDDNDYNDLPLTAAQHELEEECRLIGGQWIRLTDRDAPVTMDKYSTTRLSAFLVLDPISAGTEGKPRDKLEEGMEVVENVTVEELRRLMMDAQLTVVGSWASLLALDKLREIGEID